MSRYIDAELLESKYREGTDPQDPYSEITYLLPEDVESTPTADVEPIQHGHWIRGKNKSAFPAKSPAIWHCSCCGEMIRYNDSTGTYQKKKKKVNEVNPRCRRCGAKMDESERISAEAEEDRIAAAGIGQAFNPD